MKSSPISRRSANISAAACPSAPSGAGGYHGPVQSGARRHAAACRHLQQQHPHHDGRACGDERNIHARGLRRAQRARRRLRNGLNDMFMRYQAPMRATGIGSMMTLHPVAGEVKAPEDAGRADMKAQAAPLPRPPRAGLLPRRARLLGVVADDHRRALQRFHQRGGKLRRTPPRSPDRLKSISLSSSAYSPARRHSRADEINVLRTVFLIDCDPTFTPLKRRTRESDGRFARRIENTKPSALRASAHFIIARAVSPA